MRLLRRLLLAMTGLHPEASGVRYREKLGSIVLPAYLKETTIHVYAFMVSDDEKINSTNQHLGRFEVL